MPGSPVSLGESESIAPMQVRVTSVSRIRRERRLSRSRQRMRTGAVTGCRLALAGKDDPGKVGEEGKDRFKYIHVD